MSQLQDELSRLGAREFEIPLFTADEERGWAALNAALKANADNPVRYAVTLIEDPQWRPQKPRLATNLSVSVDCEVCGGDRFVVVSTREPAQSWWMKERGIEPNRSELIEEMGPCPRCNS